MNSNMIDPRALGLKLHPIFSCLSDGELQMMCKNLVIRKRRKREIIFWEQDESKGLHLIFGGKAKLYKTLDDGGIQILRIVRAGELMGYRGLLGNGKYIATAEMLEDGDVYFIPGAIIQYCLRSNQLFAMAVMRLFASDLSEVELKKVRLVNYNSRQRLAEALMQLENQFGTDQHGFIKINLTRHDLGAFTGLVYETIIRILKSWEEAGIIALGNKVIGLRQPEALHEILEGVA